MKLWIPILVIIVAVGVLLYVQASKNANNTPNPTPQTNANIQVSQPAANATVTSPLAISGQAVGGWYFEASFPIKLYDAGNNLIGQTTAQAQSDWMTTAMVPFTASLTFPAQTTGSTGTLVFAKDNPSGEPANDDSYSVSVVF